MEDKYAKRGIYVIASDYRKLKLKLLQTEDYESVSDFYRKMTVEYLQRANKK